MLLGLCSVCAGTSYDMRGSPQLPPAQTRSRQGHIAAVDSGQLSHSVGWDWLKLSILRCELLILSCDWLVIPILSCNWLKLSTLSCDWMVIPILSCDWLKLSILSCDWLSQAMEAQSTASSSSSAEQQPPKSSSSEPRLQLAAGPAGRAVNEPSRSCTVPEEGP